MASFCQVTRELVTDLPVQLAAGGFLADALHVRPGEITVAGELPERLGASISRADPAVAVRVLPGVAKRPGRAVLRSPFAPLFEEKRHVSVAALVAQGPGPGRMRRPGPRTALTAADHPLDQRRHRAASGLAHHAPLTRRAAVATAGTREQPRRQVDGPEQRFARQEPDPG